jgi:hypothetical protein
MISREDGRLWQALTNTRSIMRFRIEYKLAGYLKQILD